jgi:endonuclease/exonuclease/phosphatase (EEP) superfamily protein YafD
VPDIAVLSEVKEQDLETIRAVTSIAFAGPSPKKGVAVVGWNGWKIEQVHPVEQEWFLPVVASRGSVHINILAVWVIPTTNYVEPTLNELVRRKEFLSSENVIVTGDLNANVIFDKGRKGTRRFAAALEIFADLGLASVWHETKSEPHGRETSKSLFHVYNEAKAYHIDYAFVSKSLMSSVSDVTLGTYVDWVSTKLSDHAPLIVKFDMLE